MSQVTKRALEASLKNLLLQKPVPITTVGTGFHLHTCFMIC